MNIPQFTRSRTIVIILLLGAAITAAVLLLQRFSLVPSLKSSVLDATKLIQIIPPSTQGFAQDNAVFPIDFTTNLPDYPPDDQIVTFQWTSGPQPLIQNLFLNFDLPCSIVSTSAGQGAAFPASEVKIIIPKGQPAKCAGTALVKSNIGGNVSVIVSPARQPTVSLAFDQLQIRRKNAGNFTYVSNNGGASLINEVTQVESNSSSSILEAKCYPVAAAGYNFDPNFNNTMNVAILSNNASLEGAPLEKTNILLRQRIRVPKDSTATKRVTIECSMTNPPDSKYAARVVTNDITFPTAPPAQCGNGVLEAGEACDNEGGDDSCSSACIRKPVPPPPYCGDGIKQTGEACDDGNSNNGDGCSNTCKIIPDPANNNAVFITSSTFTGNFGGLSNADQACQTAATDANLEGDWKAMISAPKRTIEDLAYGLPNNLSTKPFLLLDTTKIADNADDLLDGLLQAVITVTEKSDNYKAYHDGMAWTGSTFGGTLTSDFCQKPPTNPTTGSPFWTGATGTIGDGTRTTNAFFSGTRPCNEKHALYCLRTSTTSPAAVASVEENLIGSTAAGIAKNYIPGSSLQGKGLQKFEIKTKNAVTDASVRVTSYKKLRAGVPMPAGNNSLPIVKSYAFEPSAALAPEMSNAVLTIQTSRSELKFVGIKNIADLVLGHYHNGKWSAIKPQSLTENATTGKITLVFGISNFSDVALTTTFPSDQVCGNGSVETGEQCDDGNASNTDDCLNSCSFPTCGDGFTRPASEACDDGTANGTTDKCTTACQAPVCGDNLINRTEEQCDVNAGVNANLGQACEPKISSNACKIKNTVKLKDSASLPVAYTQQQFRLAQALDFDKMSRVETLVFTGPVGVTINDKTFIPTEAKNYVFHVDVTYTDNSLPASTDFTVTPPAPVCGNNVIETGEPCDDGNNVNTDACLIINSTCQAARCGDGEIRTGVEQCERKADGSFIGTQSNQTCSNTCQIVNSVPIKADSILQALQIKPNLPYAFTPVIDFAKIEGLTYLKFESTDTPKVSITNAEFNKSEGAAANLDPGINASFTPNRGGKFTFLATTRFKTGSEVSKAFEFNVLPSYCGNNVVESGEECEDNNGLTNDSCIACKNAICGDGFTRNGPSQNNPEQCDDKNSVNDDSCTNACTIPRCGDNIFQPNAGEECDMDQGLTAQDLADKKTCSNTCQKVGKLVLKDTSILKVYVNQPFKPYVVIDVNQSAAISNVEFKDIRLDQWLNNRVGPMPFFGSNINSVFYPNEASQFTFKATATFADGHQTSQNFTFTAIQPVCGNNELEPGETCEANTIVTNNQSCENCVLKNNFELKDVPVRIMTGDRFDLRSAIDFSKTSPLRELNFARSSKSDPTRFDVNYLNDLTGELPAGSALFTGKGSAAYFYSDSPWEHNIRIKAWFVNGSPAYLEKTFELTVAAPVCGNKVIERGEQCDGITDAMRAKRLTCGASDLPEVWNRCKILTPLGIRPSLKGYTGNKFVLMNAIDVPSSAVFDSITFTKYGETQKITEFMPNQNGSFWFRVTAKLSDYADIVQDFEVVVPSPECGNAIVELSEACDEGSVTKGGHNGEIDRCTTRCLFPVCGDTDVNKTGEECDDSWGTTDDPASTQNKDGCVYQCKRATCGDGYVWENNEQCDSGKNPDGSLKNGTFGEKCTTNCKALPFPIPRLDEEWNNP